MTETTEILLRLLEEARSQVRQYENQRAAITGLIVVIASAIQGALAQLGFSKNSLTLTITLIVLGVFGIITSYKLYERASFLADRATELRKRIDELHPELQIEALIERSRNKHMKTFKITANRVPLSTLWLILHSIIVLLGIIYSIIIIAR